MKTLPYFRWFPADAKADALYGSFTDQELGFFHRCLDLAWDNDGLPVDLNEIAAITRVSREYLDSVWPRVGRAFIEVRGRLRNRRQEEERNHATAKSRQAAKATAAREEKRDREIIGRSSDDHLRAYGSDSVCVVSSTTEETTKNKTTTDLYSLRAGNQFAEADQFEVFWQLFIASGKPLNDEDRRRSLTLWLNHDPPVHAHILAWVIEQMKTVWREERFTPMPQNALESKGWTRKAIRRVIPNPDDPTVKLARYRASQRERGLL